MAPPELDEVDHQLLVLLTENSRRTLAELAAKVNLSPSAVKRRVDRLERSGVITGYTAVVDHAKAGRPIEAFTEVRFRGSEDLHQIQATAAELPDVQAVFTTAGDPDALVWLRVSDVARLGHVIELLRRSGRVTGTKTLIVLDTWTRPPEP